MRRFLESFTGQLEQFFTKLTRKNVIKELKEFFQTTLEKVPKSRDFEKHSEIIKEHSKRIHKSSIEKILSFLKSEVSEFKKNKKKNDGSKKSKIEDETCYAVRFMEEVKLLSLFLKSLNKEFKSFFRLLAKYFTAKIEMVENLLRGYFDYFSTFYSDLKLRTKNYGKFSGYDLNFYLVNNYNIDQFNVSINFKM